MEGEMGIEIKSSSRKSVWESVATPVCEQWSRLGMLSTIAFVLVDIE
jgi:hypothetical protein